MAACRRSDPVTYTEAAAILDVSGTSVMRTVRSGDLHYDGGLSRAEVERVAAEVYPWFPAAEDRDLSGYWVAGQQAADVLGVNRARLGQPADEGRLPFVRHRDGTRLFRRHQVEIIANARTQKAPKGVRVWWRK